MTSSTGCDWTGPLPSALLKKLDTLTPWHEQVEALQQLADLTVPLSKKANTDAIMRQLRPYGHDLAGVINNPRSTLVKEACLCIEALAETFGPKFVAAVGTEVIPALLNRCAITKAVIRDSSREAAKAMFEHGVEGVFIGTARFISQTVLDKQAPVLIRTAAAEFIGMILVERCRGSLSDIHQLISDAIIGGCSDSDETVRAISRDNCCRLLELEPTLGDEVFEELPTNAQQYIAGFRSLPKAGEEASRTRRASMMPQRARPRPESFAGNVPASLKARYAPSRLHRASINPVDLGTQALFSDSIPPRTSILPRPSRVEFEPKANLPRKHSRPTLRPPRRSMVPKTASVDMENNAVRDENVSKTSPSTRVIAPSHSLIKPSSSAEFTHERSKRSATQCASTQAQDIKNRSPSQSPVSMNAPAGAEDAKKTSLAILTESTEKSNCENEQGTPLSSTASTASKTSGSMPSGEPSTGPSPRNDAGAVDNPSRTFSNCSEPHSPTETKPISNRLCSPTPVSSEACKSTPNSQGSPSCDEAPFGKKSNSHAPSMSNERSNRVVEEESVKRVNKGRLSFIMGVNETPQVIRARSLLRPDMSASAFMMSPGSIKREGEDTDVGDEMDIDTMDAVDEAGGSEAARSAENGHTLRTEVKQIDKSGDDLGETERTTQDMERGATLEGRLESTAEQVTTGESTESRDLEQTATSNESERRFSEEACATTTLDSGAQTGKDEEEKINDSDRDADSTEQLLKTPQLCMPDISDFAELMADIEKQALSSVAPNVTLSYEMAAGSLSNDKENKASETRKQKRVQLAVNHGARKDSADMKPPAQKSRAASFKGRPPRRSLMPQNVAASAASTGEDRSMEKKKLAKPPQQPRKTTTRKQIERKASTKAVDSATSRHKRVTASRPASTRTASAVGSSGGGGGGGASSAVSEKRKRSALAPRVQQVADALRSCRTAAKEGWEQKTNALTTLHERTRALGDDKLPARLAEDCAVTACELLFDGHNKVSLAALESLFFLLLCSEGSAQTKALQRALHRRGDALRRVLALTRESREDRRLASERVLDAFCVQFAPETQVALTLNAMTADVVRSVDARVATGGCGVLTRAFERAERNEGGFVWRGAVLELLISTLARLATDRRLPVRRASKAVAAAAARCLPERAFDMACRKVRVRSALFK